MSSDFGPGTIVVDDFNPSILYTCGGGEAWSLGGAVGLEYNNTAHGASSTACKVEYSFSGTYVAVYGTIPGYSDTIPGAGATSQYFIDNLTVPDKTYTAHPVVNTIYQQLFFSSDPLSEGNHSLTVTLAEDNVVNDSPGYWVDFLVIIPGPSSPDATQSLVPTTSVTVTSESHQHSSLSTGAIVGAAVGGIIFLIGAVGVVFVFLRHRRRHSSNSIENLYSQHEVLQSTSHINSVAITPFILTSSDPTFRSPGQVKPQTEATRVSASMQASESEMPPPY